MIFILKVNERSIFASKDEDVISSMLKERIDIQNEAKQCFEVWNKKSPNNVIYDFDRRHSLDKECIIEHCKYEKMSKQDERATLSFFNEEARYKLDDLLAEAYKAEKIFKQAFEDKYAMPYYEMINLKYYIEKVHSD